MGGPIRKGDPMVLISIGIRVVVNNDLNIALTLMITASCVLRLAQKKRKKHKRPTEDKTAKSVKHTLSRKPTKDKK